MGHIKNGFPERLEVKELPYYTFNDSAGNCFGRTQRFCNEQDKREKVFVIGDSTIHPLATSLNNLQSDFAVIPVTAPGCILVHQHSLYDSSLPGYQDTCLTEKFGYVSRMIADDAPILVVYGGMLSKAISGTYGGVMGKKGPGGNLSVLKRMSR